MPPYGSYVSGNPSAGPLDDDVYYDAVVKSEQLVMDDRTGTPLKNASDKFMVDVVFDLGNNITRRRRFSVAFGVNQQNGKPAAFAKYLSCVHGVTPTDPKLMQGLDPGDSVGKRCRIMLETVNKNGQTYQNVEGFKEPGEAPAPNGNGAFRSRPSRPTPAPAAATEEADGCRECGGQLYADDGDTCLPCRSTGGAQ